MFGLNEDSDSDAEDKPEGGFLSRIGTWGLILAIVLVVACLALGGGPVAAGVLGIGALGASSFMSGGSRQQQLQPQRASNGACVSQPDQVILLQQPRMIDGIYVTHGVEIGPAHARRTLLGKVEGSRFLPAFELVPDGNQDRVRKFLNAQPIPMTQGNIPAALPAWLQNPSYIMLSLSQPPPGPLMNNPPIGEQLVVAPREAQDTQPQTNEHGKGLQNAGQLVVQGVQAAAAGIKNLNMRAYSVQDHHVPAPAPAGHQPLAAKLVAC